MSFRWKMKWNRLACCFDLATFPLRTSSSLLLLPSTLRTAFIKLRPYLIPAWDLRPYELPERRDLAAWSRINPACFDLSACPLDCFPYRSCLALDIFSLPDRFLIASLPIDSTSSTLVGTSRNCPPLAPWVNQSVQLLAHGWTPIVEQWHLKPPTVNLPPDRDLFRVRAGTRKKRRAHWLDCRRAHVTFDLISYTQQEVYLVILLRSSMGFWTG